ncbi:MAG: AbrB/MazE/SpoVT family DNA-binding domain-containing protein [Candidatus Aenigmatarchaeota archaeon]
MKLQKQLSRKSGNTVYPKWVVVIPPEKIKETGWREGEDLEADVKDGKIVLKTKKA